jgi:acyl phosphate:glycerol-3-phosphate acyltransferase
MPGTADSGVIALPLISAALAGYVLGSLPFGYIVAKAQGVNIFEAGSKSSGATNIRRTVGTRSAILVLALDAIKGAAAAGASLYIKMPAGTSMPSIVLGYVALAFAIIGHSFSCFTKFRGGKGVATAAGGLFVLMPVVAGISAGLWAVVYFVSRYASVASMTAAVSLPIAAYFLPQEGGPIAIAFTSFTALFVVVRHRANIGRLMAGTEKRSDRSGASAAVRGGK